MIEVIKVKGRIEGNLKAHDILKALSDGTTLLALSGGTSPDYRKMIVESADILPGGVCMVDERYGFPNHPDSNESLLEASGLVTLYKSKNIPFVKALSGLGFEETGMTYDFQIRSLFEKHPKKIGIMGVGGNLHTAGIFPQSPAVISTQLAVAQEVNDKFPKRITMTIKALSAFSTFVILAFGQEKKEALKILLDKKEQNVQKYPAIFYRTSTIKSFLMTDIEI